MMLNDKEKLEIQNLLKLIRRSKFDDFQGVEALALARAYHWLENLLKEPIITPLKSPILKEAIPLAPAISATTAAVLQPIEEKPVFIPDLAESPKSKRKKKI